MEKKASIFTVDLSIKDTEVFKYIVALLKDISMREDVPQEVKDNINTQVDKLNKHGGRKIIICQNCGALLVDFNGKSSHIHLESDSISFVGKRLTTLKCRCGCITQYCEY